MSTAIPEHDEALEEDDSFSANPLAFTPGLFHSLDALNDVDDGTLDQFKAGLDQRNSHSPPSEGQTRSTVSPDPSSGAPFTQRRRSSERDNNSTIILNAHNANSPSTYGDMTAASSNGGGARPMPSARSDGGSEPITIHSAAGRPSPPLSGAAGPSNAFDVSYTGPPPASQFNFVNAAHPQQQNWIDPATSTPFDPSQVISFASGSPPFPDSQMQQRIRGAVMQGMQQARTQSQGPLHISTPNGNNLASTTLQTQHPHPGLSVSPSYPPEFTFPANRDSGGVHASAAGAAAAADGMMPPSASSPSPSPSFSSSSVSTPVYANPNFLQSGGNAPPANPGAAGAPPPPPPTIQHPNPRNASHPSLRSSSRPSPTPESGSSRESGHPYPSATRHGGRTRRHPSDPNQLQTAQQHSAVTPDMSVYNLRRTSLGPPAPPRMTPRRSGMSPTIPPGRARYEQDNNLMAGGTVRLLDPATNQQLQFNNLQQWNHAVQADQSLNSPSSNGSEQTRVGNRGSSSATSSGSSLEGWNSVEDLRRLNQQGMDVQSPVADAEGWQWSAVSGGDSSMMQPFNGTFDPAFGGLQEGPHYSPTVPAIAENGYFQDGMILPGQVSPPAAIQHQQAGWGPQALSASIGLQGLHQ
ncbi:hypothetical protein FRC01_001177 [Tulasnella sp. 417]|nr:hypothetical protein FRC01_001177 [Tulasnella sp. 417]